MSRALELARRGGNRVSPNPRVGCVVVRGDEIVGEGWHQAWGGPHAEVEALRAAGERAAGGVAYVTLEPCGHQGKTPPCTNALIAAGIKEVVAAMRDPNPLVAGKGLQQLSAAGIKVRVGLHGDRAEALNRGYVKRLQTGLPYLRCKIAASLDGQTALANGVSRWISGEDSRRDVHEFRAQSDAILTGIGTLLADDPRLDARTGAEVRNPVRIVLDSRLRFPPRSRMLGLPGRTVIFTGVGEREQLQVLRDSGAEVVTLQLRGAQLCLQAVMQQLGNMLFNEVWLEAGATLAGAFLAAGLVDELVVYLAPHLLGQQGHPLAVVPNIGTMGERLELRLRDICQLGGDVRLTYTPVPPAGQTRSGASVAST